MSNITAAVQQLYNKISTKKSRDIKVFTMLAAISLVFTLIIWLDERVPHPNKRVCRVSGRRREAAGNRWERR